MEKIKEKLENVNLALNECMKWCHFNIKIPVSKVFTNVSENEFCRVVGTMQLVTVYKIASDIDTGIVPILSQMFTHWKLYFFDN